MLTMFRTKHRPKPVYLIYHDKTDVEIALIFETKNLEHNKYPIL